MAVGDCGEVGFTGDEASHSADGVFDAAFLPRGVGVTEVGLQIEAVQAVWCTNSVPLSKVIGRRSSEGMG